MGGSWKFLWPCGEPSWHKLRPRWGKLQYGHKQKKCSYLIIRDNEDKVIGMMTTNVDDVSYGCSEEAEPVFRK
eukprot:7843391-Karenia_brevis.AAC.1